MRDAGSRTSRASRGRRRHRRPALPGLLAAQPRRRRTRTTRPLARIPPRARARAEPDAFVMENVPELLRSDEYAAFKAARRERARLHASTGGVLNAADYGVPQRRRRAIVIGVRDGEIPWPDADALRPGSDIPLGGAAVEDLPRRRRRAAAQADRQGLAQRPQPAAGDDHPLPARPARRRQPLPDAGQPRRRRARPPRARAAGGTSRPGRPTSSAASTGTARRSRSAPSSTSPRRAATSTRPRTGRSRSARPRAA